MLALDTEFVCRPLPKLLTVDDPGAAAAKEEARSDEDMQPELEARPLLTSNTSRFVSKSQYLIMKGMRLKSLIGVLSVVAPRWLAVA
jgi:hypothetical protein